MARRSKAKNNRVSQSQEDKQSQRSDFMKKVTGKNSAKDTSKNNEKTESTGSTQLDKDLTDRERKIQEQEAEQQKERLELDKKSRVQQALQEKLDKRWTEAEAGFEIERKRAVAEKEKELSELEKEHTKRIKNDLEEIKINERQIFDRRKELNQQEANAKAGFIDQENEALEEVSTEVEKIKAELATLRTNISNERSQHSDWLKSREAEFSNRFVEEQTRLEKEDAELQVKLSQLSRDKKHLDIRKTSQQQWEDETRLEIRREFQSTINDLEGQLDQERSGRKADQDKLAEQNRDLIKFRDFQRSMDNADPQSIHDELEQRREEIKELKAQLRITGSEDLSEKCDDLEEQVSDQQERINQLMRDLEQANAEVHRVRMSVAAKHNLEKEKKVLELHNKSLDTAITQLRIQLDELIEKQQGSKVFPALSALDQKHQQNAANLQIVPNLKNFCHQVRLGLARVNEDAPLYYREEDIRIFLAGLAMSNLHILQGMSGTGKTSLAIAFAKVVGGHCTNIAVQAGWRDKDDLLGHYNAFEKKFYEREALQALYKAQLPEFEDRLNIILLDEMNLSRPEQYFAELLSALELRASERNIVLVEEEQINAPNELIQGRKIKVPDNVWFIGTANHDETTNEFADKTYDRSHVMELKRNEGSFSVDDYEHGITYSYDSFRDQCKKATSKHQSKITDLLELLNESELSITLEENCSVSWGNRLERHALRFIPVVIETGGSIEEALDHLLATKVLRRGNVIGRFDINIQDIDAVVDALNNTWKELKLEGSPQNCLELLSKDRNRLEYRA